MAPYFLLWQRISYVLQSGQAVGESPLSEVKCRLVPKVAVSTRAADQAGWDVAEHDFLAHMCGHWIGAPARNTLQVLRRTLALPCAGFLR